MQSRSYSMSSSSIASHIFIEFYWITTTKCDGLDWGIMCSETLKQNFERYKMLCKYSAIPFLFSSILAHTRCRIDVKWKFICRQLERRDDKNFDTVLSHHELFIHYFGNIFFCFTFWYPRWDQKSRIASSTVIIHKDTAVMRDIQWGRFCCCGPYFLNSLGFLKVKGTISLKLPGTHIENGEDLSQNLWKPQKGKYNCPVS